MASKQNTHTTHALLTWFATHARTHLPWRIAPHGARNPYHVLLSEIMLQQTTVAAVIPYFEKFLKNWPTIQAFSQADEQDVLSSWAGLGYYARARNLLKAAKHIVEHHQGIFPQTPLELQKLPGIGPYTAKAIAALCFNAPYLPIDGNVERLITRLFGISLPMPKHHKAIDEKLQQLLLPNQSGLICEALIELGALVCKPKNPMCSSCPLASFCLGKSNTALYPNKQAKPAKALLFTHAFILTNAQGDILMRQRPQKGLLANMLEVPNTPWLNKDEFEQTPLVPHSRANWTTLNKSVRHIFTHIDLHTQVHIAQHPNDTLMSGEKWIKRNELSSVALPNWVLKLLKAAQIC